MNAEAGGLGSKVVVALEGLLLVAVAQGGLTARSIRRQSIEVGQSIHVDLIWSIVQLTRGAAGKDKVLHWHEWILSVN